MTDAETIRLVTDLEEAQDALLAEEARLDAEMESGDVPEDPEFDHWLGLHEAYVDLRDQVLEVIDSEPEGNLESPAFLALEMAELRTEAIESRRHVETMELGGVSDEELKMQLARAHLAGCLERIEELGGMLSLLKVGSDPSGVAVIGAGAATLPKIEPTDAVAR